MMIPKMQTIASGNDNLKGRDYEKINYNYCFGSSPNIGRMC